MANKLSCCPLPRWHDVNGSPVTRALRLIVTKHIDNRNANSNGNENGVNDPGQELAQHLLIQALQESRYSFLITDPRLPDNPIVYANNAFLQMTGYSLDRVVGHNFRFMQGPDTNPAVVATRYVGISSVHP